MHSWTGVVYMGAWNSVRSWWWMHGKKKRKDTPALVLSASGCFAIENVIEPYSSIIVLFSRFNSRSVLTHIDYAASLYYNYHRTVLWSLYVHNSDLRSIFIRIVLSVGEQLAKFIFHRKVVCPTDHGVKSRKIGGAAGCPAAVRTTFRVEADWLDIENCSGRKLLHESLYQVPRLSGQIERTRTATAIIVDQLLATDLSSTSTNTLYHRLRLFILHRSVHSYIVL